MQTKINKNSTIFNQNEKIKTESSVLKPSRLTSRTKFVVVNKKVEKREATRETAAEKIADIDKKVKNELIERLKKVNQSFCSHDQGTYDSIVNIDRHFAAVLQEEGEQDEIDVEADLDLEDDEEGENGKAEVEEEKEEESEFVDEFVEDVSDIEDCKQIVCFLNFCLQMATYLTFRSWCRRT